MNSKPAAKKVGAKKKAAQKKEAPSTRSTQKPTKPSADQHLTRIQIMAMLGVTTPRRIAQLQTRTARPLPYIRKGNSCVYDCRRFFEWLSEEIVTERVGATTPEGKGENPSGLVDKRLLDTRKLQLQIEQLEIANSRERMALGKDQDELAPTDLLIEILSAVAGEISPIVESLPGELQKSMEADPAIIKFITQRLDMMLNTISALSDGDIDRFITLADPSNG